MGYLSREDARSFRRRLKSIGRDDEITKCDAVIVGGFLMKNGKRAYYGVRLDLKEFG